MWTQYFPEIPPVVCSQCSENAFLVRRSPNPKNVRIEVRIFICGQGHKNIQLSDCKITDEEVEAVAQLLTGIAARFPTKV